MFTHIFIFCCFLNTMLATDILSVLWEVAEESDDEILVMKSLRGEPLRHDENKMLIRRLSQLPFTEKLKSNAWRRLVQKHSVRDMDVHQWKNFEPLIPFLPASLLQEVNFSNPDVLAYFGQQEFKQHQLSHMAEEVKHVVQDVLGNETSILRLGNIFCGFSASMISEINDRILRILLQEQFFRKLTSCSPKQLYVLINLLRKYRIVGSSRTWSDETVWKLGAIVAGLTAQELRDIPEKSFAKITANILALIPPETLKQLRTPQVKSFDKSTLLAWRRKTLDLRDINASSLCAVNIALLTAITGFFLMM